MNFIFTTLHTKRWIIQVNKKEPSPK